MRLIFFLTAVSLAAQPPAWKVRSSWVQAHEDFLANDVLQGRGSATRDEGIAANYVAAQFALFGLRHAPGMPGFVSTIPVEKTELDGHAALSVKDSADSLEGSAFYLFSSSGANATGKLLKVSATDAATTKLEPNTAVLLTGLGGKDVFQVSGPLMAQDPAMILVEDAPSISEMFTKYLSEKTQTSMELAGRKNPRPNIVVLHAAAVSDFQKLDNGVAITLTVHAKPAVARFTYNAIGYLPGSDAAAGTILITAHLDHLGVGKPKDGDAIYNGADDDASGTTAVLELAHALAAGAKLRRSVLFVCFGSEEEGDIGSTYFRENPPISLAKFVANVEFEMIGAQDPKMPKGVLLFSGWERSNLGPTLRLHGARLGPDPYPEQHFFERSDNYALARRGIVAHTAAGYAMPPWYHQPDDDTKHLDVAFMTEVIESMIQPLRWLANSTFTPKWNPNGAPK